MNAFARALPGARLSMSLGPTRRTLAWCAMLAMASVGLGVRQADTYSQLVLLLSLVAGVGMGTGSVGGDRLAGRSTLFFQRAVTPAAHYLARTALCSAVFAAGAIAVGVAATLLKVGVRPWVDASWAFYWAALLLIVSTTLSAMLARHDSFLTLGLLAASLGQGLILAWLDMPALRELLQWALLPIDASAVSWQNWREGNATLSVRHAAQLLIQPLAWTTLLILRLEREDLSATTCHAQ
jgi:hypothetical protein